MTESTKLKVFLCHASQDKPIVRDMYHKLAAEGWINPWLDEEKILAGQEWEYEIEKAVEAADIVIVFLSNTSVSKEGYIQKELRYALDIALEKPEGAIFIIPVRLDDCVVPRKIRHWQYVDYFPSERCDLVYKKVLESIRAKAKNREESIQNIPSVIWVSNGLDPKPDFKFKPALPTEWQQLEPSPELGDRKPHSVIDSRNVDGKWYICGASRRGKLHENEAAFREDAFQVDAASGWILVAVADGAGSHHLSRVGSNLAVKTSIETMTETVMSKPPTEDVVLLALQKALKASWIALSQETERRKSDKVEFRDLSTTLLLLMYYPKKELVGVAQIGDGLIAAQLEDGKVALLGHPESGEYSGQTYFLTNHTVEELPFKCETLVSQSPIRYVFVMTDGVADDLYPPQERLLGLIKAIPEVMGNQFPDKALLELINYNRPGSFDDRTLVVVCKRDEIRKTS